MFSSNKNGRVAVKWGLSAFCLAVGLFFLGRQLVEPSKENGSKMRSAYSLSSPIEEKGSQKEPLEVVPDPGQHASSGKPIDEASVVQIVTKFMEPERRRLSQVELQKWESELCELLRANPLELDMLYDLGDSAVDRLLFLRLGLSCYSASGVVDFALGNLERLSAWELSEIASSLYVRRHAFDEAEDLYSAIAERLSTGYEEIRDLLIDRETSRGFYPAMTMMRVGAFRERFVSDALAASKTLRAQAWADLEDGEGSSRLRTKILQALSEANTDNFVDRANTLLANTNVSPTLRVQALYASVNRQVMERTTDFNLPELQVSDTLGARVEEIRSQLGPMVKEMETQRELAGSLGTEGGLGLTGLLPLAQLARSGRLPDDIEWPRVINLSENRQVSTFRLDLAVADLMRARP